MAGIFDTHTHLNDSSYKEKGFSTEELIDHAKKAGVDRMCCVGFDIKSSKKAVSLAMKYNSVYAAVGIHPTEAHKVLDVDIEDLELLANANKVVAIGEVGLDYFHDDTYKEIQKEVLRKQIKIALKHNLAVMLHLRDKDGKQDAYFDAYKIIKELKAKRGIVHCFTQDYDCAKMFIDLGLYISIPGVVTFKNSLVLQETVKKISINKLVVETDAPYLAPEPNRGRVNTPAQIVHTIDKIAKLKNIEVEDVITATSNNACNVFLIK